MKRFLGLIGSKTYFVQFKCRLARQLPAGTQAHASTYRPHIARRRHTCKAAHRLMVGLTGESKGSGL